MLNKRIYSLKFQGVGDQDDFVMFLFGHSSFHNIDIFCPFYQGKIGCGIITKKELIEI